jgi:hypothetical protein
VIYCLDKYEKHSAKYENKNISNLHKLLGLNIPKPKPGHFNESQAFNIGGLKSIKNTILSEISSDLQKYLLKGSDIFILEGIDAVINQILQVIFDGSNDLTTKEFVSENGHINYDISKAEKAAYINIIWVFDDQPEKQVYSMFYLDLKFTRKPCLLWKNRYLAYRNSFKVYNQQFQKSDPSDNIFKYINEQKLL